MSNLLVEDIYALETVPDNSLLILSVVILALLLVSFFVLRKLIKNYHFKKYKEIHDALKVLEGCDFTQSKNTAYQISYYGKVLVSSEKQKQLFHALLQALELYKYEKPPQSLSLEVKKLFETFLNDVKSTHV